MIKKAHIIDPGSATFCPQAGSGLWSQWIWPIDMGLQMWLGPHTCSEGVSNSLLGDRPVNNCWHAFTRHVYTSTGSPSWSAVVFLGCCPPHWSHAASVLALMVVSPSYPLAQVALWWYNWFLPPFLFISFYFWNTFLVHVGLFTTQQEVSNFVSCARPMTKRKCKWL